MKKLQMTHIILTMQYDCILMDRPWMQSPAGHITIRYTTTRATTINNRTSKRTTRTRTEAKFPRQRRCSNSLFHIHPSFQPNFQWELVVNHGTVPKTGLNWLEPAATLYNLYAVFLHEQLIKVGLNLDEISKPLNWNSNISSTHVHFLIHWWDESFAIIEKDKHDLGGVWCL